MLGQSVSDRNGVRVTTGQRDDRELKHVSALSLRASDGAWWKLEDGMSRKTGRKPPWKNFTPELLDSLLAVQINQVDGEMHPECVYGLTRDDPQAFAEREFFTPEQPPIPPRTAVCNFHASGKDCLARQI